MVLAGEGQLAREDAVKIKQCCVCELVNEPNPSQKWWLKEKNPLWKMLYQLFT